jgi:hypothetical protein
MKLKCSPEEFSRLIHLELKKLLDGAPRETETTKAVKPEPIAGLSAAPSKEMQDYMETVSSFVFEHKTDKAE